MKILKKIKERFFPSPKLTLEEKCYKIYKDTIKKKRPYIKIHYIESACPKIENRIEERVKLKSSVEILQSEEFKNYELYGQKVARIMEKCDSSIIDAITKRDPELERLDRYYAEYNEHIKEN
jgi:GTP1/Obg family GTP-binding protein